MASNGAVEAAIREGKITELSGYEGLRREVPYGENSRIDLLLEDACDESHSKYWGPKFTWISDEVKKWNSVVMFVKNKK